MPNATTISPALIHQWIRDKFDVQRVKEELLSRDFDDDSIDAHVREFKRLKYAKRQTNGVIYLAGGAFLGFISCVLTLINPVPVLYNIILYGLTSISILVICLGLYYLLES